MPHYVSLMKRTLSLLWLILLSGCLRYTPSYKELQERYEGNNPAADHSTIGGEQEFRLYEQTLSERLADLVAQRSYLLTAGGASGGYPVGAGDILGIEVFGFGNLSSQSSISSDGFIAAPLIGRSRIAGLTIEEARDQLTRQYSRFVKNPQVLVSLKSPQATRVSVMGEVAKPGLYPLTRRGVLLTEILSEAGGRTQNAGNRILLLPAPRIINEAHTSDSTPSVHFASTTPQLQENAGVEIDLEVLTGQIDQRPLLVPVLPGDTIVVPEAGVFEVDGEVTVPGSYKLASRTSALGAIAAAQGLTYAADVNHVEVIRDTGGGRKALMTIDLEEIGLQGKRDIRLRNGDLVRVPSEPNKFFKRQIVESINGLFNGVGVSKRMN
jgi:polysaccharide export outer membrane protein